MVSYFGWSGFGVIYWSGDFTEDSNLLHWNMDQKTEIRSYIKCRIRLNIDSKQIFNELCSIYIYIYKVSVEDDTVLEGLKPLLPRLTSGYF